MRVPWYRIGSFLLVLTSLGGSLSACGPSQSAASPVSSAPPGSASGTPAASPQVTPTPTVALPPSAAPPATSKSTEPEEPPPLVGSVGKVPASEMPQTCSPATVRERLTQLTNTCRGDMKGVCGKLLVQAKHGEEDVAVSFDVGDGVDTKSFVGCVTKAMQSVRWECAEPGKDISLDLGSCL